jgi:hypothetical protein
VCFGCYSSCVIFIVILTIIKQPNNKKKPKNHNAKRINNRQTKSRKLVGPLIVFVLSLDEKFCQFSSSWLSVVVLTQKKRKKEEKSGIFRRREEESGKEIFFRFCFLSASQEKKSAKEEEHPRLGHQLKPKTTHRHKVPFRSIFSSTKVKKRKRSKTK